MPKRLRPPNDVIVTCRYEPDLACQVAALLLVLGKVSRDQSEVGQEEGFVDQPYRLQQGAEGITVNQHRTNGAGSYYPSESLHGLKFNRFSQSMDAAPSTPVNPHGHLSSPRSG